MGTRDDIIKTLRGLFKDDPYDDQGIYDYSEGGEGDDWDHRWMGDGVTNSVMTYEDDDGWAVSVGNGQELFSQTVAEGITEDEMQDVVSEVTGEYQSTSAMEEGYITLEDMDDIQSMVDETLTESEGSEEQSSLQDYEDEETDTESPGDDADAEGEESTDLGADVADLVEGAEGASEGSGEDGGDDPEEDEEAADEAESDPETDETAEGQGEGGAGSEGGGNPWVSYQGQAGGQGWQNVITGEIRYQDEQPAPTEEEEEQMAEQQAVVDEESGLSEGDPVTVDMPMSGEQPATIAGTGQNEGGEEYIEVELEDGTIQAVTPEMIESDPSAVAQQEPGDGFADGWAAPPDDLSEVETGDYVEVYDAETGEWHNGQKTSGGMDDYMQVQLENGEEIEILRGTDTGYVATAVEDSVNGIPMDEEFIEELEVHDEVLYDSPGAEGFIETEVVDTGGHFDTEIKVEDHDGDWVTVVNPEESLYHDPPEWSEWDFGDDMELLTDFEGEYVKYSHPSRGVVSGPLTVQEDAEGDLWFHIDGDDNGEGMNCSGFTSKGGHPLSPDNVDVLEVDNPFNDWRPSQMKEIKPGDRIRVDDELLTVSHVDMDGFMEVEESDEIIVQDLEMAEEYDMPVPEDAWVPDIGDAPEPPDEYDDGWNEPPSIEDAGTPAYYEEGDMVWFVNDDHEAELVEVEGIDQYGDIITNKEPIPADSSVMSAELVQGHVKATSNDPDILDPSEVDLEPGDQVTYRKEDYYGDVDEYTGVIKEINHKGNPVVTVTEGGSGTHTVKFDGSSDLLEHNPDYDPMDMIEVNGMEADAEDIADDMLNETGINLDQNGSMLSKSGMLWKWHNGGKSEQESVKERMYRYFPQPAVDDFYGLISEARKPSGEERREALSDYVFMKAFGLDAKVRFFGKSGDTSYQWDPSEHVDGEFDPQTADWEAIADAEFGNDENVEEMIKLAELSGTLSQRFYEANQDSIGKVRRSCVDVSLRSMLNTWLDDPSADTLSVDGRATNNFQPENGTWTNEWKFHAHDLETEQVMLMTDFMFNPSEEHKSEEEIWVTSDGLETQLSDIGIGTGMNTDLAGDIDEWSSSKTRSVAQVMAKHFPKMKGSDGEITHGDEWSESQMDTLLHLADKIEESGADTQSGIHNLKETIRGEAEKMGMLEGGSPSASGPDQSNYVGGQYPDAEQEGIMLSEGDTITLPGGSEGEITQVDEGDPGMPYKVEYEGSLDGSTTTAWYSQDNLAPAESGESEGSDDDWEPVTSTDDLTGGATVRVENENYGNFSDGEYTVDYVDEFGDVYLEGEQGYINNSGTTEIYEATAGSDDSAGDGPDGLAVQDPENWKHVEQGADVSFYNEFENENVDAYYHSMYDGEIIAWDQPPSEASGSEVQEFEVDPQEVIEVNGSDTIETAGSPDGSGGLDGNWETGQHVLAYDAIMDEEMPLEFTGYNDGMAQFQDADGGKFHPDNDQDLSIIEDDFHVPDSGDTVYIPDFATDGTVTEVTTSAGVYNGVTVDVNGEKHALDLSQIEAGDD